MLHFGGHCTQLSLRKGKAKRFEGINQVLVDCLQEWAPAKVVTRLFSFFKVCVRTRANVNEATRRWHK